MQNHFQNHDLRDSKLCDINKLHFKSECILKVYHFEFHKHRSLTDSSCDGVPDHMEEFLDVETMGGVSLGCCGTTVSHHQ